MKAKIKLYIAFQWVRLRMWWWSRVGLRMLEAEKRRGMSAEEYRALKRRLEITPEYRALLDKVRSFRLRQ